MAKKRMKAELKRPPTKHQLSRWQRQQRIQRIIVIVGTLFFVLILSYIGYGYYEEQVKPLHRPVLKIDGTVFDMDYYIKSLELYSRGMDATATSDMANRLVGVMEYSEIIRRTSPDLGFNVSADEIDSELKNRGLPDEKVYRDVISATLLTSKILQNYFDPKVPTECEQVQVQAMFLESNKVANEMIDRLVAGDDFSSLAKEYSVEAITKEIGGEISWLPKDFADVFLGDLGNSLLKDIAFNLEPGVLSKPTYDGSVTKKLGYWLVEVVEKDEDKGSHARGMLLGSRQEAEEIKARIEAGEDFGALAEKYSQDLASKKLGGDLGWIQQGGLPQQGEIGSWVAAGFALQLEPGVLSQPVADDSVQTKGGYWLVKVLDRDDSRAFGDEVRGMLKMKLFENWVNEQRGKSSAESYLTEEQKAWAVARVLKDRG